MQYCRNPAEYNFSLIGKQIFNHSSAPTETPDGRILQDTLRYNLALAAYTSTFILVGDEWDATVR